MLVLLREDPFVAYLRKSRSDMQNFHADDEDILKRHEQLLLDTAKRHGIKIAKIYREVKSGETIASRPVMQQLLQEVEDGLWSGVLVVEVERLARGDTIDQGIVAQAFKYSNTLIITPNKIYDPNNEFDEEYFEFGLFMSRREYKVINRRLQRGRVAAVNEGKYLGNVPPYGYQRIKLPEGWSLIPDPDQSPVVKMIFDYYVGNGCEQLGCSKIARRLNELHIKPAKGDVWVSGSIKDMLANPVYIGIVRWNRRAGKKIIKDGVVSRTRPRADEYTQAEGLHEPIIDKNIFEMAQDIRQNNSSRPVNAHNVIRNPLAGLVVCAMCGRKMLRRPHNTDPQLDVIMCCPTCKNVGSQLSLVETRIISSLSGWLDRYKLMWRNELPGKNIDVSVHKKNLSSLDTELEALNKQLNNVYTLFERDAYDIDTFNERKKAVMDEIANIKKTRNKLQADMEKLLLQSKTGEILIPKIENVLDTYYTLHDPAEKNRLLKDVLEKVVYKRYKGGRWCPDKENFEIVLFPKIPKI